MSSSKSKQRPSLLWIKHFSMEFNSLEISKLVKKELADYLIKVKSKARKYSKRGIPLGSCLFLQMSCEMSVVQNYAPCCDTIWIMLHAVHTSFPYLCFQKRWIYFFLSTALKASYALFLNQEFPCLQRNLTNFLRLLRKRIRIYLFDALQADPTQLEEKRITRFFQHLVQTLALEFIGKEEWRKFQKKERKGSGRRTGFSPRELVHPWAKSRE